MELNPFSYEFHRDPYPTYRWLREHAPLYRNDRLDFWAPSRFADVMAAFVDWETYSSAEGITLERLDPKYLEMTPMMILLDPPRHDRLRKLVSRAFTPRRVAGLEPLVRDLAVRLLEPLAADGGGDFVTDFSNPMPMEVIFTLLGVPDDDRERLREWTDVALSRDPDSPETPPRAVEAMMHTMRYWYQLLPALRARPNDGLICALFDAEIETDDGRTTRLSDGEDRRPARCWAPPRSRRPAPRQRGRPLRQHQAEYAELPRRADASGRSRSCSPQTCRRITVGRSPATSSGTGGGCRRGSHPPLPAPGDARRAALSRSGPVRHPPRSRNRLASARVSTSASAPRSPGSSRGWRSRSSASSFPATPWTSRVRARPHEQRYHGYSRVPSAATGRSRRRSAAPGPCVVLPRDLRDTLP